MVLRSRSLCCVWGRRSHPSATCGVTVTVGVVYGCHGRPFHATCRDAGPILPLHVVLWSRLSLSHRVCCGRPFRTACGVMGPVLPPHVVLQLQLSLSLRMWCCSRSQHGAWVSQLSLLRHMWGCGSHSAMCGVAVAVFCAMHGVAGAISASHVVLQSRPLPHMSAAVVVVALHKCHSRSL